MDNTPKTNDNIPKESDKKEKEEIKLESNSNKNDKIKKESKPIQKDKKSEPSKESIPSKTAETKNKEKQVKDDFRYIVRIANTDIDGEKTIERGLTSIKGIGMHMSTLVIGSSGLDRNLKMGNLSDKQIEKIQDSLENILKTAPSWMLNHQKDAELGKDVHFIGSEIEMKLRDEINIMKRIRSYKGIRHERGLTVRGQRTRANNRKGLTLGVSKKVVQKKK